MTEGAPGEAPSRPVSHQHLYMSVLVKNIISDQTNSDQSVLLALETRTDACKKTKMEQVT